VLYSTSNLIECAIHLIGLCKSESLGQVLLVDLMRLKYLYKCKRYHWVLEKRIKLCRVHEPAYFWWRMQISTIRREDYGWTAGSVALPQLLSHRVFPVQFSDVQRYQPALISGRDIGAPVDEQPSHRLMSRICTGCKTEVTQCSGVDPYLSTAETSAPLSTSRRATGSHPYSAAKCSGSDP